MCMASRVTDQRQPGSEAATVLEIALEEQLKILYTYTWRDSIVHEFRRTDNTSTYSQHIDPSPTHP